MILDNLLFENMHNIGLSILEKSKLNCYPTNIDEMNSFITTIKSEIEDKTFNGCLLADILFSFVCNEQIRDRNTTSRIFEDIFSSLFNLTCTDVTNRTNPSVPTEILDLDYLCTDSSWNISTDLSGNKREKTDLKLGSYEISLKTLKGYTYNEDNIITNRGMNKELNIGSLSYRALLKGILTDSELQNLGDRKSGLGSGTQLRKNIFNPIIEKNKKQEFYNRLNSFLKYVYTEDIYIILKSHYKIIFYLIPNESFIKTLLTLYYNDESNFEKVFYRWENNNLRLNWFNMLNYMRDYNLNFYEIDISLVNRNEDSLFSEFKKNLDCQIKTFLNSNNNES